MRVADIQACYEEWKAKDAEFLTPPIDRGAEIRARDVDAQPRPGRDASRHPAQVDDVLGVGGRVSKVSYELKTVEEFAL